MAPSHDHFFSFGSKKSVKQKEIIVITETSTICKGQLEQIKAHKQTNEQTKQKERRAVCVCVPDRSLGFSISKQWMIFVCLILFWHASRQMKKKLKEREKKIEEFWQRSTKHNTTAKNL